MRDAEAEGAARDYRAASGGEEEEEAVVRSYHDTVLSDKLQKVVRWAINMEGGGCILPDDKCTKPRRPVAEVLQEKHPGIRVPPVENPACASFKEYGEVPKTVPLHFTEDDITWAASKVSGTVGALGAEAIELCNCLLRFG